MNEKNSENAAKHEIVGIYEKHSKTVIYCTYNVYNENKCVFCYCDERHINTAEHFMFAYL